MSYDLFIVDRQGERVPDAPDECLNIWSMGTIRALLFGAFDIVNKPIPAPGGDYAYMSAPSPEAGKVASHKFFYNDGWIVNPDECRLLIAEAQDVMSDDAHPCWRLFLDTRPQMAAEDEARRDRKERLADLVKFWTEAAKHGGFRIDLPRLERRALPRGRRLLDVRTGPARRKRP